MNKRVGIILINYQDYAQRFLADCRDSLRQQTYPAELSSVIIIDNASSPATQEYLQSNYPEATILPRSDGNYAAANNLGIKTALAQGCDYVVNLNMDTRLSREWLQELVKALDLNPQVGLAQSLILLNQPGVDLDSAVDVAALKINSLGNLVHFLGFGYTSHHGEQLSAVKEVVGYPLITGYASGCSVIIRREVLEKLSQLNQGQYYNEEYFMYHDDLELSLKAKLMGYEIVLAPRSRLFHKYEFARSTKMIYYMERNRYLFLATFYPPILLALIALPALVMELGLLGYSLLGGWAKERVKMYRYFFKASTYQQINRERAYLKKISQRPLAELAKDFTGRLDYQEINNPVLTWLVNPLLNTYWRIVKQLV